MQQFLNILLKILIYCFRREYVIMKPVFIADKQAVYCYAHSNNLTRRIGGQCVLNHRFDSISHNKFMTDNKHNHFSIGRAILQTLQGALMGLGAVLPGISGGVLAVIFGVYKPVMELLAHPFKNFKTHVPKLLFYIIGLVIGFLGIANLLAFILNRYPSQSICVFVGLIGGMLPSLWKEAGEKGRSRGSYISTATAIIIVLALLVTLRVLSVELTPNFGWYIFCGMCLAISIIAPGMSFSTLLMPLGLYTPFIDGIGHLSMGVLIPAGVGALLTVICLAKAVNSLFEHHYSIAYHAIVGIVIAATIMIIPFDSFIASAASCITNLICLVAGVVTAELLDKFNSKFTVE